METGTRTYDLKRKDKDTIWGFKITTYQGGETIISDVFKGSPAHQAGMVPQQRLLSINGRNCGESSCFFMLKVGKNVPLESVKTGNAS